MTVSSVPKFFGFSIISDGYVQPTSKEQCNNLFKSSGYYETLRDELTEKLATICGKSDSTEYPLSISDFIKEDVCSDCDESNIACKFYGNQIIKKINELNSYVTEAQDLLKNYTDNNLTRLQLLDTFCKKIEIEFSHYYAYDPEEAVFKIIEEEKSASNYAWSQLKEPHDSYDKLRNNKVATYPDSDPKDKTIECFNELNLLDRLKYIKLYYSCNSGKTDSLFPNNKKEEAYPAVKVPESTAYNKETYTTGQLELFYIGYLVDRDGPIGALCSFIEFKSVSLLKNIEIESMRIKALNGYLAYLNQAVTSLNGREDGGRVPDKTYGIVCLICSGFARNIKQLKINGVTSDYLVLQRDYGAETETETKTNDGYHLSKTGYYILVKLGAKTSDYVTYHGDSPYIPGRIDNGLGTKVVVKDPSSDSDKEFTGVTFYDGFKYKEKEKIYFDCTNNGNELLIAKVTDESNAKAFLPKELDITTIKVENIFGYDGSKIHWRNSRGSGDTDKINYNNMINSWQSALDNYITNVNTAIESINTDIEVWRSKMDTWDSLASKVRHRDYEIRQNLISRGLQ